MRLLSLPIIQSYYPCIHSTPDKQIEAAVDFPLMKRSLWQFVVMCVSRKNLSPSAHPYVHHVHTVLGMYFPQRSKSLPRNSPGFGSKLGNAHFSSCSDMMLRSPPCDRLSSWSPRPRCAFKMQSPRYTHPCLMAGDVVLGFLRWVFPFDRMHEHAPQTQPACAVCATLLCLASTQRPLPSSSTILTASVVLGIA